MSCSRFSIFFFLINKQTDFDRIPLLHFLPGQHLQMLVRVCQPEFSNVHAEQKLLCHYCWSPMRGKPFFTVVCENVLSDIRWIWRVGLIVQEKKKKGNKNKNLNTTLLDGNLLPNVFSVLRITLVTEQQLLLSIGSRIV